MNAGAFFVTFICVLSSVCRAAEPNAPPVALVSSEEARSFVLKALISNLQGVTEITCQEAMTDSFERVREQWLQLKQGLDELKKGNPAIVISPEIQRLVDSEPNGEVTTERLLQGTLKFQDLSKWNLTRKTGGEPGWTKVIADGSGLAFRSSNDFQTISTDSRPAAEYLIGWLNMVSPYGEVLELVDATGTDSNIINTRWEMEVLEDKSVAIRKVYEAGKFFSTDVIEFSPNDFHIKRLKHSSSHGLASEWILDGTGGWRYRLEQFQDGKLVFRLAKTTRIKRSSAVAFALGEFASPLKPGGVVQIRTGPGLFTDVPAEVFLGKRMDITGLQKLMRSKVESSVLKDTMDSAAQRMEDINILPPEVKKPLQDAADGAKKLLEGAETAPQESAPVTPQ